MAPLSWRRVLAADLVAAPWRNGLGISREVAAERHADGSLCWQVGIAELAGDAPFSDYRGIDRVFTVLEGGIALAIDGAPLLGCPPLHPVRFRGESLVTCRVSAPGRAFNVFVDRRQHRAEVAVASVPAGEACVAGTVVHCVSGRLLLAGAMLGAGDSAVGCGGAWAAVEDAVAILVTIGR